MDSCPHQSNQTLHPPRFARLIALSPPAARAFKPAVCVLAALLLAATAGQQASTQQPPPQYGYGFGYGARNPQNPPSSPYGYQQPAPPQYAQPQYQQPGYGQQYAQPQYQQPYAAPEQPSPYSAPNQAYAPRQPYGGQQPAYDQQQYAPAQAPLSPDQLQQLLAPVALYPDSLLAQLLTASTYPGQVAVANQWLQQMQAQGYASPGQIAAAVASQNWDPSVQGLTAFPQVLAMMDQNLEWTTDLGNAWFNQPQDVMQTVQVLRQRAQAAGTLQNTPQESLTYGQDNGDQGDIELAPPNQDDVYVPNYNPWSAYGALIAPYSGFSFGDILGSLGSFFGAGLHFGPGIAMAAFDRTPFGLLGWSLSWLAHAVLFHHGSYFTNSSTVADWGFPHGGARAYAGWNDAGSRHAGHWAGGYRGNYSRSATAQHPAPAQQWNRPATQPQRSYANSYYGRNNYGERSPQQAYRQPTPPFAHPQSSGGYNRPQYGNRYDNRPAQTFAPRSGYGYGNYRAPQSTYQRAYSESPARSFDPGRGYRAFNGDRQRSFKAPKNFYGGGKAPKGFGHEHFGHESFGHGGGFGHAKAPKMHSGGGGGHRHR